MRTKKLLTIIVLVMIISLAYGTYNISLSDFTLSNETTSYLGNITWSRNLTTSFDIARQENKPIAIYFWAIWCQYCAKFQSDTLGNPDVKKVLENDYVLVAMDLDIDRDVANRYRVTAPPAVVFLGPDGTELDRISGAVDANYFLPIATQVRDQVRSK